jgi:hypothetical protein
MGSSQEEIQVVKKADSKIIHQLSNKSRSKYAINVTIIYKLLYYQNFF